MSYARSPRPDCSMTMGTMPSDCRSSALMESGFPFGYGALCRVARNPIRRDGGETRRCKPGQGPQKRTPGRGRAFNEGRRCRPGRVPSGGHELVERKLLLGDLGLAEHELGDVV